jgi:hypothetical protein
MLKHFAYTSPGYVLRMCTKETGIKVAHGLADNFALAKIVRQQKTPSQLRLGVNLLAIT